jgi:hypothetical protein
MSSLGKVGSVLVLSAATACLGAGCAANADDTANVDEVAQADQHVEALPGTDTARPDDAQLAQNEIADRSGDPVDDQAAPRDESEKTGQSKDAWWGGWGGWGRGWGGWGGWGGGLGWGGWGGGLGWGGWGGGLGWGGGCLGCGGWGGYGGWW